MARMQQREPQKSELELSSVLYALSDPTRLKIVAALNETAEIACGFFPIEMAKSSLSHHFRVLRSAGVIATRKEGTTSLNRLRKEELSERFPGLIESVLGAMSEPG